MMWITIQQPESPNCILLENRQFSPQFAIALLGLVITFSKMLFFTKALSQQEPTQLQGSWHFYLFFFHLLCLFSEYSSHRFLNWHALQFYKNKQ